MTSKYKYRFFYPQYELEPKQHEQNYEHQPAREREPTDDGLNRAFFIDENRQILTFQYMHIFKSR